MWRFWGEALLCVLGFYSFGVRMAEVGLVLLFMSAHLYYSVLAGDVPQDMSMSVLCDSSQILAGRDSKYGMTLCFWYDCPEKNLVQTAKDGSFYANTIKFITVRCGTIVLKRFSTDVCVLFWQ